jgi:aminoglycoside phosphotransferase (APT) family kinase protein
VSEAPELETAICAVVRRIFPGTEGIAAFRRLSGGASQETWAFERVEAGGARTPLILRRAPGGTRQAETAVGMETEAQLMRLAGEAGAPEPVVHYVLTPGDGAGRGFITNFVEGETLGRRIVREPRFARAREVLAAQCGRAMAAIHATDPARLPPLRVATARGRLEELHARYRATGRPKPVFSLAFEALRARLPPEPATPRLVHADFRNGNIIVGEEGLRAVLDWEIAHLGDPVEDLGWICVSSWRFGGEGPVGGFGTREQLVEAYEAAGGEQIEPARLLFWELLGVVSWGVSCASMVAGFRGGIDPTSERAMIARRSSETEIDILNLLAPRT